MILDIDIGNTRLKWRLKCNELVLDQGAFVWRSEGWSKLKDLSAHGLRRIRVSNVGGEDVATKLDEVAQRYFGLAPEYAFSCESVGMVMSGYLEPERLGVDRWLAILAGWELIKRECVIVDAGSALTIDVVDSKGAHLGGYITPGREMMRSSLYGSTSGVLGEEVDSRMKGLGNNTSAAVQNGSLVMTLALIEKVVASVNEGLVKPALLLTGGDAETLREYLPEATVYKPNLVLDGLAIALP